jgi:Protein of unknown function (DUF998)
MATFGRPFRTASVSGLAAVAVYVAATILGGLISPGYSHVRNAISELTASHAAHRVPLAALYVAYNVLLVGFAHGLVRPGPASRLLRSAFGLGAVASTAGIAQVTLFPQDSTGSPGTTAGALHIALAGLSALLCVVTAAIYGVAFRRERLPRAAWVPAFAVAAFLLLVGPVAAASVGGPLMGLLERFTIGGYLTWVAVTCLVLSRVSNGRDDAPSSPLNVRASLRPDPDSGALHEARPARADGPRTR